MTDDEEEEGVLIRDVGTDGRIREDEEREGTSPFLSSLDVFLFIIEGEESGRDLNDPLLLDEIIPDLFLFSV